MTAPPHVACIGLGGNVGDAASTVRQALQALDGLPGSRLLRCSPLYRSRAWGGIEQPDFINAVAVLRTTLPPPALLDALLDTERRHGRDRDREQRWGPRTLDLDLLLYGQQRLHQPGLHVPHPQMHARAFVLVPLADVLPDADIPGIGTARDALARLPADAVASVVRLDDSVSDLHTFPR